MQEPNEKKTTINGGPEQATHIGKKLNKQRKSTREIDSWNQTKKPFTTTSHAVQILVCPLM